MKKIKYVIALMIILSTTGCTANGISINDKMPEGKISLSANNSWVKYELPFLTEHASYKNDKGCLLLDLGEQDSNSSLYYGSDKEMTSKRYSDMKTGSKYFNLISKNNKTSVELYTLFVKGQASSFVSGNTIMMEAFRDYSVKNKMVKSLTARIICPEKVGFDNSILETIEFKY